MTKVRKQKRKKNFQYNINRKRLKKKVFSGGVSEAIGSEWKTFIMTQKNFKKNGLAFDVNQDIKFLNKTNPPNKGQNNEENIKATKLVSELEESAKICEKKQINMSQDQMDYLGYLIGKYGDNYKDMARDRRNYLQYTWKQLRNKIKTYKIVNQRHGRILKKLKNNSCKIENVNSLQ